MSQQDRLTREEWQDLEPYLAEAEEKARLEFFASEQAREVLGDSRETPGYHLLKRLKAKEEAEAVQLFRLAELYQHEMTRADIAAAYSFLPLGWRVLQKLSQIVREEMNRVGAQELLLPALQPLELWQRTPGRVEGFGPELMRLKDRNERELCLGPTHEEVVTTLVGGEVRSYRELPLTLYQIQVKFRDQFRPRGGLIRAREFIMKDAYSFDADGEGLDRSYDRMVEAYHRILARCEIPYRV